MFSAAHFAWLAVLLAAGGGVCLAYKNADENSRRIIRRAAAWGALGIELLRAALLLAAGEYNIGRLPLHLRAPRVARRRADGAVPVRVLYAWRSFRADLSRLGILSGAAFHERVVIRDTRDDRDLRRDAGRGAGHRPRREEMPAVPWPDAGAGAAGVHFRPRYGDELHVSQLAVARLAAGMVCISGESRLRAGLSADPRRRLGGDVLSVPPDGGK